MLHGRLQSLICVALTGGGVLVADAQVLHTEAWFERQDASQLGPGPVQSLMQDGRGNLWIGTYNGLHRFDGYEYATYGHDPHDPNSLYDTTIRSLELDGDAGLWIGTFSGVEHLDFSTGRFTRVASSDTSDGLPSDQFDELLVDRAGNLWAGSETTGLFRVDPGSDTIRQYSANAEDATALMHNDIDALFEDRDGVLWVTTGLYGFHRYDPDTDSFERVHVIDRGQFESEGFADVAQDSAGTFWLGAWGLVRFDPKTGETSRFLPHADLQHPTTDRLDNFVAAIELHDDDVWVGTANGLSRFDRATQRFQTFQNDVTDPTSLPENNVFDLLVDGQANLWVGTDGGGLARTSADRSIVSRFSTPSLNELTVFAEDDAGGLWTGLDDRLVRYDPGTGESLIVPYTDFMQGPGELRMLKTLDSDPGMLWIGADDGFLRQMDRHGRIHQSFRVLASPNTELGSVVDIVELAGDPGVIWIAGFRAGICRLDRSSGESRCFPEVGASFMVEADPLDDDIVWSGSGYSGLYRFDTETRTVTDHFRHVEDDSTSLSIDFVQSLHASTVEPGILWVGTWNGGLNRLDTRSSRVTRQYTSQNSDLPGNIVSRMAESIDGTLWLPTDNGLAALDGETGIIRDRSHVPGSNGFLTAVAVANNADLLVEGWSSVLFRYRIASFAGERVPPAVHIDGVLVNGEVLIPDANGPLEEPAWLTDQIVLRFDERDVTFSYVAPDLTNAAALRYAYRLEGYDAEWHSAGGQRHATYTNLPPGQYDFSVRATYGDATENASTTSISLIVRPPWWRTVWAYLSYGLVFAGLVLAVDRTQRRRLIRRERERTRERELQQAREIEKAYTELKTAKDRLVHQEKLASLGQLTAGIAHEIKNPLNFINNFADVNAALARELREAYEANPDAKLGDLLEIVADIEQNAAIIGQHGARADSIVRNMMQHASGGTGSRTPTDINKLVAEHVDLAYHGKRAQIPDLSVEVERDMAPDAGSAVIVPQEIGRVIMNLLSNAFDAVHAHSLAADGEYDPEVRVTTLRDNGRVVIRVSDNGPGIPAHVAQRIFEPFFTTKPTGVGTGLGLSMSHEIVTQGHGGSLTVTSEPGAGATFEIVLPGGVIDD